MTTEGPGGKGTDERLVVFDNFRSDKGGGPYGKGGPLKDKEVVLNETTVEGKKGTDTGRCTVEGCMTGRLGYLESRCKGGGVIREGPRCPHALMGVVVDALPLMYTTTSRG